MTTFATFVECGHGFICWPSLNLHEVGSVVFTLGAALCFKFKKNTFNGWYGSKSPWSSPGKITVRCSWTRHVTHGYQEQSSEGLLIYRKSEHLIKNFKQNNGRYLPSVESTFSQASFPPNTSSTSFNFGYFLLDICQRIVRSNNYLEHGLTLNSQTKFVILLTVNHTILVMLVQRI